MAEPVPSSGSRPPLVRSVAEGVAVFAVGVVAMVAATWPLGRFAGSRVPMDLGDPLLNAYLLGWGGHAVVNDPLHLFNATLFDPEPYSLALMENMLGLSIPLAPLFWITDNAVLVANVALFAYSALAGLGAYLLIRELTSSRSAALVSAVAYTVMPVRLAQVNHLHVSAAYAVPFVLLLLVRLTREEDDEHEDVERRARIRRVVGLAIATAVGIWTSMTGAVLMGLVVLAWLVWVLARRRMSWGLLRRVSLGLGAGLVLSVPVLLPYFAVRDQHPQFKHSEATARQLSALPSSYLSPPPGGGMAREVYADLSTRWGPGGGYAETQLFPGLWLSAMGVAAVVVVIVVRRRERLAVFWLGTVIVAVGFVFSLGPRYGRHEDGALLPFTIFQWVGGLTRVPARMGAVVPLGLAILAAWALSRAPAVWRRPLAAVSLVAVVVEFAPAALLTVTAPEVTSAHRALAERDGVVLGIPTTEYDKATGGLVGHSIPRDTQHLFLSTVHFRRIINGYAAYHPPSYWEVVNAVQELPSAEAFAVFKRRDIRTVVVQTGLLAETRWSDVVARMEAWPGVRLVDADDGVRVYDVTVAAGTAPA